MSIAPTSEHKHFADDEYNRVLVSMQSFSMVAAQGPLFKTDVTGLFDLYLETLPAEDRQYHNCNACRHFLERFGDLAWVDENGNLRSAMWDSDVEGYYFQSIKAMRGMVTRAKIVSVFASDFNSWGVREIGGWTHFSVKPNSSHIHRRRDLTPYQVMALSKENRRAVLAGLRDFGPDLLDTALSVLKADAVTRADRFIAPTQWLRDLHDRPKGRAGDNLLWKAVAMAPEGYCHPRGGMVSTLLEDIEKGLPFDDIKRRWGSKMHPLQYQRPQAAPSEGTIKQAEVLFEKMELAPSLERRFARLEEVRKIWSPSVADDKQKSDGVFAHLKPKSKTALPDLELPTKTMTWKVFSDKVLPEARALKLMVPGHGHFTALVTAVHPDAPPILKWDFEDNRYPVSHYVYVGGSPARQWGLTQGRWTDVNAIVPKARAAEGIEEGYVLVLEGARDNRTNQGNALFPECLKAELHGVRSVIEAYSRTAGISGSDEASANGLSIGAGRIDIWLSAFDGKMWSKYHIDRFE